MDEFIKLQDLWIIVVSAFGIAIAVLAPEPKKSHLLVISGIIFVSTAWIMSHGYGSSRGLLHGGLYLTLVFVGSFVHKRYAKQQ